ncbi:MAG: diguanylate cyclase [Pedobacter sp.]|nr:diguanylate cyclase [Pedobacter sp.]
MSTPVTQEAIENELREIQGLLDGRRRLRFSAGLEAGFRNTVKARTLEILNHGWWTILLFYLAVAVATYAEVRMLSYPLFLEGNLKVWWVVVLTEGLAITSLILLPRIPLLLAHFWLSISLIATMAIAAITIATSAFPDPYFNQHSSYVVIFIISLIYGIGGMRLVPAAVSAMLAAVLSWAVIWFFDLWLDWGLFAQYVILANVVGMLICYLLEQRERRMFLQARLLELEKGKLDSLSRELSRLSREDVLTGLANRRHFNEVFQLEWDRARREQQTVSLIFVDIDHFKPFNDNHGHLEGDRVLSQVGQALRDTLRRPGDLAARYGGEEFVLLLPGTPATGAMEVAAQVREAVEALRIPHHASTVGPHVTASVGVATLSPELGLRSAQLIAQADEAVYAAKAAGRNCIKVAAQPA